MSQDNKFSWDESKNQSNLEKHGITFRYAVYIFSDENRIESEDTRKEYGEKRYKVIGKIDIDIVTLIYTPRLGLYRIISARGARKDEKEDYLLYVKARQQTQAGQN